MSCYRARLPGRGCGTGRGRRAGVSPAAHARSARRALEPAAGEAGDPRSRSGLAASAQAPWKERDLPKAESGGLSFFSSGRHWRLEKREGRVTLHFLLGCLPQQASFSSIAVLFALVCWFCVPVLQRGSGYKMLREIRGVMGGFEHHRTFSSGSAAKRPWGKLRPAQVTSELLRCLLRVQFSFGMNTL